MEQQVLDQQMQSAEPEQQQLPLSPLVSPEQRGFFSESSVGTDFFQMNPTDKINRPLSATKAAELAFSTAILTGQSEDEMQAIAGSVASDLSTTGVSPLLGAYEQARAEEDKKTPYQLYFENKDFLKYATEDPQAARELLAEAEAESSALAAQNKRARLISDTVQRLTPEQKKVFNDSAFIMSEIVYQQSLEQTFSRRIASDQENASLWDWAAVLASPFTAVTSRADQSKLMAKLAEAIGPDPRTYAFKANHGRIVADYLLDPSLKVSEVQERLDEVQAIMDSMDYEDLGVNPLHASEMFEVIRSQLRDKDSEMTVGNLMDVLDATVLGTEVVGTASLLKRAADALTVRLFGQLAGASRATTEVQLGELEALIKEATKPAASTTPARGLLTQVPDVSGAVVASKLDDEIRDVTARIEKLRVSAAGAVSRKERKDLEAEKKAIGAEAAAAKDLDVRELTRQYQEQGLQYKQAVARAKQDKAERVQRAEAKLAALQADIDLVDSIAANKSELSRLEQRLADLNKSVRYTSLNTNKITAGIRAGVVTNRDSTFDALYANNPAVARKLASDAVARNPDELGNLGVTAENIAERIIPNPEDGLGIHPAAVTGAISRISKLRNEFQQELSDLRTTDLLTDSEIANASKEWAKSIESHSQGTLFSTHSELKMLKETGEMVLKGVFGGSVDGGFSSLVLAERALKNLFSDDGVLKVRVLGSNEPLEYWDIVKDTPKFSNKDKLEFFVERIETITPDGRFANPFEVNYISPSIKGTSYLQSWSKLVQKQIMDSFSAYVDKATRIGSIQAQMLEPIARMSQSDREPWAKMLTYGDTNEMVFSSRYEAERVLGVDVSDRAWEAYVGTRAYYDSVADVRQRAVYKHLNQNSYKSLHQQGGILTDLNGPLHVRPLVQQPEIVGRPVDGSEELFAPNGVWGGSIWDLSSGTAKELTKDLIEQVYKENKVIVRASREAEFADGDFYDFLIVDAGDIKELSKRPMIIRQGHVDVNYADQDAWLQSLPSRAANKLGATGLADKLKYRNGGNTYKLREIGTKRLNGSEVKRDTTIGIYANIRQAAQARADLIVDAITKLGPDATEAQIKQLSDMYPEPVLTREGEAEFGIDMSGTFSGLPSHARKRGERLRGPNGLADVMDIEESLSRSVGEVRRALGIDAVELQKRRFGQTYAKHMNGYNAFESDFSRFTWKEEAKAAGIHLEAERAHEWITNLDHAVSNREYQLFAKVLNTFAAELMNSSVRWKQEFGEILRDVSKAKLDTELKKITATLVIGTRFLYQMVANSAQIVNLFIHDPVTFGKDTIRRTLATMLGIAGLKIDSRVMTVVGSKMAGMTPDQFKQHLENLKRSGIVRSAAAQDIAAVLGESGKIEAGKHYAGSANFWKRMVPGLGGMERLGKALMVPQHFATDVANLFAYNHAVSSLARTNGLAVALSRRSQPTVAGDTRRLMFNQNRTDQFAYQQNLLSTQLMFFQHVHRMYNDLIIDPMVQVASLGTRRISKEGTNLYANGFASSVKTMALMSALWGAGAYPLVDAARNSVSQKAEQAGLDKETLSVFFDGLVAKGMYDYFGTKFDVQSRLSPAGALQTTFDLMFTNDGGLVLGGPVNQLATVVDKLADIGQAYFNAEPMDRETWSKLAVATAASMTSGTNDAFRARMAANMLEYVDSSGRPIAAISDTAWIPVLFSVPPSAVQTYYESRGEVANVQDDAESIAKIANRTAMSYLSGVEQGRVPAEQVIQAIKNGLKSCELLAGSNKILAQAAKEQFLNKQAFESNGVLLNHADKVIRFMEPGQAIQEITKIMEADPRNEKVYKFLIQSLRDSDVQQSN